MYPGNHTESEILSVPRNLKTRPGAPETHLAYITDDEADLLEIYKPDTPHKGPHDVPNYDSWDWEGGSIAAGGGWASGSGSSSEQQDYGSGPNLGGAGSTTDFGGGRPDTYIPPEEYYTDPIPEDIIYDDQIADYSFSTHDVRSTPEERRDFRGETGSEIRTNAENLASMAYNLTNDPKYLNQPIFVPGGMSGWQNDELYQSLLAKYKEAMATGNKELFFEAVEDLQDITAGNPNLQFQEGFGTGYDEWYKTPGSTTTGGPGPGRSGRYRSGSGGYGGSGSGGSRMQFPGAEGEGYMRGKWGPYTLQGDYIRRMRGYNRGGIVSLC